MIEFYKRPEGSSWTKDEVEKFTFPGGERHLKVETRRTHHSGRGFEYEYDPRLVDVRGGEINDLVDAGLYLSGGKRDPNRVLLPYLPAARSDKGNVIGADIYGGIIRSLNAFRVVTLDPHSRYWVDSFYKSGTDLKVVDFLPLLVRAVIANGGWFQDLDGVVAPDEGATGRAKRVADHLGVELVQAYKNRCPETGKIISYTVGSVKPGGRYLVVDDICDGGATFDALAAALDKQGVYDLALWVTHGVFSGVAAALRDSYSLIMTTDSHPGSSRQGCAHTVIPVFDYLLPYV